MHPVLESLRNTDKQWLIDTLYAFNGGNVEKFQGFKSAWGQQVMNQHELSCLDSDLSHCGNTVVHLSQPHCVMCVDVLRRHFLLQPDLATHEAKLMQKIQLLCVMEVSCGCY